MTIIEGYFEELDFSQSNIESFEFIDSDLIVNIISCLDISQKHPLFEKRMTWKEPCRIIFEKVVSSVRLFYEYDENSPDNYKPVRKIIDQVNYVYNPDEDLAFEEFDIEGLLQSPKGWLSWEICAEKFYLDDLKD